MHICNLKGVCKYFNSSKKIKTIKFKIITNKDYDVFCYLNKRKQIALTKKNNLGFLKNLIYLKLKKQEIIL